MPRMTQPAINPNIDAMTVNLRREKLNIIPRITANAAKLSVTATIYLRIFHHSHNKSESPEIFRASAKFSVFDFFLSVC
ncbi:MAG: hypothetical protein IJQ08_10310 [Synergistaceae bacterium]|nr:hypothetical protein [Synergistaceae bacterium]MBR0169052.1 hypothetical protein [Synergistaceae bacterium]